MISVKVVDIPQYLREGGFYQGLDNKLNEQTESDECVSVPADTLKFDDTVTSNEDLLHLLSSLRFWVVFRLPQSVMAFVISDPAFCETEDFKAFVESFPLLTVLTRIRGSDIYTKDELPAFGAPSSQKLERACTIAIQGDHIDVLLYLVSIGSPVLSADRLAAAETGSLDCLTYLHKHVGPCSWVDALHAAKSGHLHVLKFLHEAKCGWDTTICARAAEGGHLDCLQFLHENGCPWDERLVVETAARGHLACLIYAHEQGLPLTQEASLYAAMGGHTECIQYMHNQGVPWDAHTCRYAALAGMLSTLQYLHEHGCPWDSGTTTMAARQEQYHCLKYAVEHGCQWDDAQWEEALSHAHDAEAKTLRANLKSNCSQN